MNNLEVHTTQGVHAEKFSSILWCLHCWGWLLNKLPDLNRNGLDVSPNQAFLEI